MIQVSARLGVSVDTDKPAILARSSAKPAPARYAFPVSTQNSGKLVCLPLEMISFVVLPSML